MRINRKKAVAILIPLLAAAALVLVFFIAASSNRLVELDAEQIKEVLDSNDYPDERSRVLAESASSLVGKVHYFWGGKSYCKGPDPAWGEMRTVTSEGSAATGTERPYGLDCSGYITWIFLQLDEDDVITKIGEGTWAQWMNSEPIDWNELRIGDLVFQNKYPGASSNHVAVCIGFYRGKPVFAHCSSAQDNVVVTTEGSIFRYARRPSV